LVLHARPASLEAATPTQHDAVLVPLLEALPLKQAVAVAARIAGAPRNELYARALALKEEAPPAGGAND
ncbi:MAG: rRNA (cytidine-2'-O-)-methyltransferase, partial [Pseudomonadota bacterium]|nr:rRNA (cytidine-2'-O-)-methyltransferase [Pseudomonadota bacterium]